MKKINLSSHLLLDHPPRFLLSFHLNFKEYHLNLDQLFSLFIVNPFLPVMKGYYFNSKHQSNKYHFLALLEKLCLISCESVRTHAKTLINFYFKFTLKVGFNFLFFLFENQSLQLAVSESQKNRILILKPYIN